MDEIHEFEPNPNGRSPRSCRWCGRTKEWHEQLLATIKESAERAVERLEEQDG